MCALEIPQYLQSIHEQHINDATLNLQLLPLLDPLSGAIDRYMLIRNIQDVKSMSPKYH